MKKFNLRSKIIFLLLSTVVAAGLSITYISIESLYEIGAKVKGVSTAILKDNAKKCLTEANHLQAEKNDILIWGRGIGAQHLAEVLSEKYKSSVYTEEDLTIIGSKLMKLDNGTITGRKEDLACSFSKVGTEINQAYLKDLFVAEQMDAYAERIIQDEKITAVYFSSARDYIRYYPNIGLQDFIPADFSPTERPWYRLAADSGNGKKLIWTSVYNDAAGHGLMVTAAAPVYSSANELMGVVGIDVELDDVAAAIGDKSGVAGGYYFLLDNEYKLIFMPETGYKDIFGKIPDENSLGSVFSEAKPEFLPLIDKMKENENGVMTVRTQERDFMLAYTKMKNTGWTLVSLIDSDEYLLPLKDVEFQVLGVISSFVTGKLFPLSLIILVLIMSAGFLMADRLASPLANLNKRVQNLATNMFGLKIDNSAEIKDEVSNLTRIIDSIHCKTDEYRRKTEEMTKSYDKVDQKKIKVLSDEIAELEKFQKAAVDREMRMLAMKKEIKDLKVKLKNNNQ